MSVPVLPAGRSSARFLIETLERVSQTAGTELLAFSAGGGERLGELLHSGGQLCLMKLTKGQQPLGMRLQQRYPETAVAVSEALSIAREQGRPLGEVLLGLGKVASDKVREALLDQIADGFVEVGRAAIAGVSESCAMVNARRLSSVLSGFSPAEVYWRTMPRLLPPGDDAAGQCFDRLAVPGRMAVLLSASGGSLFPIRSVGVELGSLAKVVLIGRRVEQLALAPALRSAGVEASLTVLGSSQGSVLLVNGGGQIAMFGGLDQGGLGRALGVARQIVEARCP
jgi:hypothetical protein